MSRFLSSLASLAALQLMGHGALAQAPAPPPPRHHVLMPSPQTVAWGYYDAAAPAVLRIRSGDVIVVGSLITSSPERLEGAGVKPSDVEPALRDIYKTVTNKGPGGHILTGPIFVEGADSGDVLETSLVGTFRIVLRKDMHLKWPRPETATHWITMGTDTSLVKATKTAVREAIDFLMTTHGLSHDDAYMLTSVACDVDITQLVDGNVGVHVMIPKAIFSGSKR